MIDRIRKGRNVATLLDYLFGPGKSDEHTDPHLVAGWREPVHRLEPEVKANGRRDIRRLAGLLNVPLDVTGRRGQHGTVWHCVLSAAPSDRPLSDEDWNGIATEFMHQTGLARRDEPGGVRWVAVRHGLSKGGIDHVHIAVTLARQDGRLPTVHNDFIRARRACLAIEQQFRLTATAPADRTASVRPTRAETERAARTEQSVAPRIELRCLVQEAAALAGSETDFFARLAEAGAMIRERRSTADPERITGYAVSMPGYTNRSGEPIWYGGGKLAPDLTLPGLRRRWDRSGSADRTGPLDGTALSPRSARAALRAAAIRAAEHARNEASFIDRLKEAGVHVRLRYSAVNPDEVTGYAVSLQGHIDAAGEPIWYSGGKLSPDLTLPRLRSRWRTDSASFITGTDLGDRQALWADITRLAERSVGEFQRLIETDRQSAIEMAAETADALRAGARALGGKARVDLRLAADDFDRAAREAFGVVPSPTAAGRSLRTAAALLAVTGGRGSGLSTLFMNLANLAQATAELRRIQGRDHQAKAAQAAAITLRRLAKRTGSTKPRPWLTQAVRPDRLSDSRSSTTGAAASHYRARGSRSSGHRKPEGPAP